MYVVTRQRQWPEGELVVEISEGGIDYTNPDALSAKFEREFEEIMDPREAVEVAINIAEDWQASLDKNLKTNKERKMVGIAHGATGGFTMPFEPTETEELIKWAEETYRKLPKCDECGGILPDERERFICVEWSEREFCSERCAERAWEADEIANAELNNEESD